MMEVSIGGRRYHLHAADRNGAWTAHAERADSGARFGIECPGSTEPEAVARLERWLNWQHEHASALAALQDVQRAYHRTVAGEAFGRAADGSPVGAERTSLDELEAAGARLADVRARMPI